MPPTTNNITFGGTSVGNAVDYDHPPPMPDLTAYQPPPYQPRPVLLFSPFRNQPPAVDPEVPEPTPSPDHYWPSYFSEPVPVIRTPSPQLPPYVSPQPPAVDPEAPEPPIILPPLSPRRYPRPVSPLRQLTPDSVIRTQLPPPSELFSLVRQPLFDVQNVSAARQNLAQSGEGSGSARAPLSAVELVELARVISSLAPFLEPHGKKTAAWQRVRSELVKLPSFKHKEISAQTIQSKAEALLAFKKV